MEIVVVGRHVEVPERFRRHVTDKLGKVEQLAPRAQRIDVEITHEKNPRQSDLSERVELTVRGKGPVVRAEASADASAGARSETLASSPQPTTSAITHASSTRSTFTTR